MYSPAFRAENQIDALCLGINLYLPGYVGLLVGRDFNRLGDRALQSKPLGLQRHIYIQGLVGVIVHGCAQARLVVDDEKARRLWSYQQRLRADDIQLSLTDLGSLGDRTGIQAPGGQVIWAGVTVTLASPFEPVSTRASQKAVSGKSWRTSTTPRSPSPFPPPLPWRFARRKVFLNLGVVIIHAERQWD